MGGVRSTQDKWLAKLDADCKGAGIELIVDFEYANTGTLRLQQRDSFDTALAIPFRFNKGHLTIGWMGRDNDKPAVFRGRPNPRFAGFEDDDLQEAIDSLIVYAKG